MDENARMEKREIAPVVQDPVPAFASALPVDLREQMTRAVKAWKLRAPSPNAVKHFTLLVDQPKCSALFPFGSPWPSGQSADRYTAPPFA